MKKKKKGAYFQSIEANPSEKNGRHTLSPLSFTRELCSRTSMWMDMHTQWAGDGVRTKCGSLVHPRSAAKEMGNTVMNP